MTMIQRLKSEMYVSTENGDAAYATTCSANLDFFGVASAMRYNQSRVVELFQKAYKENPALALKNALYLRDIRHGQGERTSFRTVFHWLCEHDAETAEKMMDAVIECGRYDDLLEALATPAEDTVVELIQKRIEKDLQAVEQGKPVSLCAKWLPSINTSSEAAKATAKYLAKKLGLRQEAYRKLLAKLRTSVLENQLREKDYSFDYEHIPSKAMMKYRKAFIRNDEERYREFLEACEKGEKTLSSKTLYPYEIISGYHRNLPEEEQVQRELSWKNLPRTASNKNTIVVRDGSGSMMGLPIEIATSLSILCSEMLEGEFRNKFITFSAYPELVELPEGTLLEKLEECWKYDDYRNTDLEKVYDLILRASSAPDFKKEDAIERILIISDMEFDQGVRNVPTYETFKKKYEALGLELPEVVFWNVCARNVHFAAKANQPNIRFVSGASHHVLDNVLNDDVPDAYSLMMNVLERYSYVDDWFSHPLA